MRGTTITILAATAIAACGGSPDLEVRTYELDHLDQEEAENLLRPYVRSELGGVFPGGGDARAITVRERPGTLQEIERVLAEHDRGPYGVALEFQVLEAGSFDDGGDDVPGVDTLLRDVLKFEDYRTVARAVVRANEDQFVEQNLGMGRTGGGYLLRGLVGRVTREDAGLHIELFPSEGVKLIETGVTVPMGQTVVLGTAAGSGPDMATILTVRPTLLQAAPTPAATDRRRGG